MTTVVRITVSKPRDTTVRVRVFDAPDADGKQAVRAEEICDGRSCEVMFCEQIISTGVQLVVDEIPSVQRAVPSSGQPHVDADAAAQTVPRKPRKKQVT